MKLSDAVKMEGYSFRVLKHPARVKGGLGKGQAHMWARVYQRADGGYGVACKEDSWDFAYSAAHEIAEHQWGFRHTADMFCAQANLLSSWIKALSVRGDG